MNSDAARGRRGDEAMLAFWGQGRWILRAAVLTGLVILEGDTLSPTAEAQRAAKVARVGYLTASPQAPNAPLFEAFRQGLRDLGYVEGQNLAIEFRSAEGDHARLPALAAELVRERVEVIVTAGQPGIRAALGATREIPIVMAISGDALQTGLVPSLARPGGNLTGLSVLAPELSGKRLQLLKETLPRLSRVAVLWNPANQDSFVNWQATQGAAQVLGLALQSLEVRAPGESAPAFAAMSRERAGAVVVLADPLTVGNRVQIVEMAARHRLPGIYFWKEFVEAGGLMSYGPSFTEMFRRAAIYVDKILKGARPADLPVEQPMRFELVLNLKTARALGITFPPTIMIRADRMIE
jgi:putative ABC transport system substrate-binding protein